MQIEPLSADDTRQSLSETLIAAISAENLPDIKAALEAGADVETRYEWGGTLLIGAACYGRGAYSRADIARLLVEGHADVNATDKKGGTALMYAAYYGAENIVRLLIDNGADLEMKDNQGQMAED